MSRLPAHRILPFLLLASMAWMPAGADPVEYRARKRRDIIEGGLIKNHRTPTPGTGLGRQHDYPGPRRRNDGHDEERIARAQAKRERRASRGW